MSLPYNLNQAKEKLENICNSMYGTEGTLKKELVEILEILTDENKIYICWSIKDIIERGKENNIKVSDQNAQKILKNINDKHDCNYGISWNTIDCHIDEFLCT